MKRNNHRSKDMLRISRRDNLPLLRGMFVSPQPATRVKKSHHRSLGLPQIHDDGLILTAREGYYLGG